MQTLRVPDVSYSSANPESWPILDQATLSTPVNAVINKAASLSNQIGQLSGIKSRVIAYIHHFVVTVYHEKIFTDFSVS